MLQELIESAVIIESLSHRTKSEALREVLDACAEAGIVPRRELGAIGRLLEEREALGSTGIGNGVAVPHVKSRAVKNMSLALARCPDGLDYHAVDGQLVHTIFLILAPADRPQDHLQALRWVSSLARNPDFRRFVRGARDGQGMRDLLQEMSSSA